MSKVFYYQSVLAPFMDEFIKAKEACGQHTLRYKWVLDEFDRFLFERDIKQPNITKELIKEWHKTRINDKPSTLNFKYLTWIQLARYMSLHGYDCFIPQYPKYPKNQYNFTPYIFTHAQIEEIFEKSDQLELHSRCLKVSTFCVPAVLRLLYSTGLRISEALSIKNKDIQFDRKSILIKETKNKLDRLVPINESLEKILLQYKLYRDNIPIKKIGSPECFFFIRADGTPCTQKGIHWHYRIILKECGIPYLGNHHGPRIQDLRHTFAVHALVQMAKSGMDLYVSLPILSTFLGHTNLAATEKYVRLTHDMYPEIIEQCSKTISYVFPKTSIL